MSNAERGAARVGPALALLCALGGCVTAWPSDEARRFHDNGVRYLELSRLAPDARARRQRCERAEESCRLALEHAPGFAHAYNCLGIVSLTCNDDREAAIEHWKRAISINPDFVEAHNNLGAAFLEALPPDYAAACEQFQAALEIAPSYADARENYALCLMRWGALEAEVRAEKHAEARRQAVRLLEIEPANATAQAIYDALEGGAEARVTPP